MEEKYLMVVDYTLDKASDKNKRRSIEKIDVSRTLIDTDGKLPDNIALKIALVLMTCFI